MREYPPGTVRNWRTGPARKETDGSWTELGRQEGAWPDVDSDYLFGKCHILAAAILDLVPWGEPFGLFLRGTEDEILHSVVRLPNTQRFVDAAGVVDGVVALARRGARFAPQGNVEWRPLTTEKLERLASGGDRTRLRSLVRAARSTARSVVAAAETGGLSKGKKAPAGTVHTWADGEQHKKTKEGTWEDVCEGGWEVKPKAGQLDLFGLLQAGATAEKQHAELAAAGKPPEDGNFAWVIGEGTKGKPWEDPHWASDLKGYDWILINASGGKDSQAMMGRVAREMIKQGIPRERAIVVHADLGEDVVWKGEVEMARTHATAHGFRFEVVKRDQGDLLTEVRERYATMIQREADVARLNAAGLRTWEDLATADPEKLVPVIGEAAGDAAGLRESLGSAKNRARKLVTAAQNKLTELAKKGGTGKEPINFGEPVAWPSSSSRFCTSHQKTAPIEKWMTGLGKPGATAQVDFGEPVAWPSSSSRFCTSDQKRAPIRTLMTSLEGTKILNCMGLRAEESPSRAKRPAFEEATDASTKKKKDGTRLRQVDEWNPIHTWPKEAVWFDLDHSGLPHHFAYDLGMPRLSCLFCIFQPKEIMKLSAQHNPEQFKKWLEVERHVKHSIKSSSSLEDLWEELQAETKGQAPPLAKALVASLHAEAAGQDSATPASTLRRLSRAIARVKDAVAVRLHWKRGGLCIHLDTPTRSFHVGWADVERAPACSMAAAAVAGVLGLPVVEEGAGPEGPRMWNALQKGRGYPIGTVRVWRDGPHKKVTEDKWTQLDLLDAPPVREAAPAAPADLMAGATWENLAEKTQGALRQLFGEHPPKGDPADWGQQVHAAGDAILELLLQYQQEPAQSNARRFFALQGAVAVFRRGLRLWQPVAIKLQELQAGRKGEISVTGPRRDAVLRVMGDAFPEWTRTLAPVRMYMQPPGNTAMEQGYLWEKMVEDSGILADASDKERALILDSEGVCKCMPDNSSIIAYQSAKWRALEGVTGAKYRRILFHEYGHAINNAFGQIPEQLWPEMVNLVGKNPESMLEFVSAYGHDNGPSEDFAEAVAWQRSGILFSAPTKALTIERFLSSPEAARDLMWSVLRQRAEREVAHLQQFVEAKPAAPAKPTMPAYLAHPDPAVQAARQADWEKVVAWQREGGQ